MFSLIECRLYPSRLVVWLTWMPVAALALLAVLGGMPLVWVVALVLVTGWSLWRVRPGREPWVYLRWNGSRVTLFDDTTALSESVSSASHCYDWAGLGRRNAWYMRLRLHTDSGRYDLTIWRDSVSDASWRALNACYRIQSAALRQPEH